MQQEMYDSIVRGHNNAYWYRLKFVNVPNCPRQDHPEADGGRHYLLDADEGMESFRSLMETEAKRGCYKKSTLFFQKQLWFLFPQKEVQMTLEEQNIFLTKFV